MSVKFSRSKRIAFGTLLLIFLVATIEILSFLVIRLVNPYLHQEIRRTSDIFREQSDRVRVFIDPDSRGRIVFDATLGWRYRANYHANGDQLNSQGLRSIREYSQVSGRGVIRVAAFGNSFVYCNEVGNNDAWPALIDELYPNVEVLNYGVGGFGLDQAYLRFVAEGSNLSPNVVIIGFSPIMLRRSVNVYRRFISNRESPLMKPRFVLDRNGDLVLLPNPLRHMSQYERYLQRPREVVNLGKNDYWYEPAIYESPFYDVSAAIRLATTVWIRVNKRYVNPERIYRRGVFNQSSSAFRIQVELLEKFVEEVRASGAQALIVIFPDRGSIIKAVKEQEKVYDPLTDDLKRKGLEYIDLSEAFLAARAPGQIDQWFMPGGHYSPAGNEIVAAWLGKQIQVRIRGTKKPLAALEQIRSGLGRSMLLPKS